jgi:hypothetical protein
MSQKESLEKIGNSERLRTDVAFRNALIANPKTILEKEFGLNLSSNTKVFLHENNFREMHIILVKDEKLIFGDSLDESVEKVLDEAIQNDSFRKLLIADPKGTLTAKLPDYFVPNDFKLFFHENNEQEFHILIPNLAESEDELSEAELESVVGGKKGRGPHIGRKRGGSGPRCRSQKGLF